MMEGTFVFPRIEWLALNFEAKEQQQRPRSDLTHYVVLLNLSRSLLTQIIRPFIQSSAALFDKGFIPSDFDVAIVLISLTIGMARHSFR
jgi:hypothetical protein